MRLRTLVLIFILAPTIWFQKVWADELPPFSRVDESAGNLVHVTWIAVSVDTFGFDLGVWEKLSTSAEQQRMESFLSEAQPGWVVSAVGWADPVDYSDYSGHLNTVLAMNRGKYPGKYIPDGVYFKRDYGLARLGRWVVITLWKPVSEDINLATVNPQAIANSFPTDWLTNMADSLRSTIYNDLYPVVQQMVSNEFDRREQDCELKGFQVGIPVVGWAYFGSGGEHWSLPTFGVRGSFPVCLSFFGHSFGRQTMMFWGQYGYRKTGSATSQRLYAGGAAIGIGRRWSLGLSYSDVGDNLSARFRETDEYLTGRNVYTTSVQTGMLELIWSPRIPIGKLHLTAGAGPGYFRDTTPSSGSWHLTYKLEASISVLNLGGK